MSHPVGHCLLHWNPTRSLLKLLELKPDRRTFAALYVMPKFIPCSVMFTYFMKA